MHLKKLWILVLLFLISPSYAATSKDFYLFDNIFKTWTAAFNKKNIDTTCHLFAKNVVASYQGTPAKNYHSICNNFKNIFAQKNYQYHYRYRLHQIYRSQNLAAVRITWYLTTLQDGKKISTTQDEGIDIFEKQAAGWKIINYIGYPISP